VVANDDDDDDDGFFCCQRVVVVGIYQHTLTELMTKLLDKLFSHSISVDPKKHARDFRTFQKSFSSSAVRRNPIPVFNTETSYTLERSIILSLTVDALLAHDSVEGVCVSVVFPGWSRTCKSHTIIYPLHEAVVQTASCCVI
jgi:hypothetical protein